MIEPLVQETANWAYLTVRSTGEAGSVLRSLERAVSATDPMMAPMNTTTLAQVRTEVLARDRFIAILLGVFALAGALLAAVGVYGVVAQVTQRRLPEMQIRLALGAQPGGVGWLIVRHGVLLSVAGIVAGLSVSAVASDALRALLFRTSTRDVLVYGLVAGLVLLSAVLASWLPARRIGRRDVQLGLLR
jgi:ABC-type antimicrobial peptide transport system permease subunit